MPKACAYKTGFNLMIIHFHMGRKLDKVRYDTGSNPADINRLRNHTGKKYDNYFFLAFKYREMNAIILSPTESTTSMIISKAKSS